MSLDLTQLTPVDRIQGDDQQDTELLRQMSVEARGYLSSFAWCSQVVRIWFGFGVGGVVAVFLCEIVPASAEVDSHLWVVVGDLPPAYLVTDDLKTSRDALASYVEEMRGWVDAVRTGGDLDDVMPVKVPATLANADKLATRLDFVEKLYFGVAFITVPR